MIKELKYLFYIIVIFFFIFFIARYYFSDENYKNSYRSTSLLDEKIIFLKIVANVIKSGMSIIGVETPEKM